MARHRTYQVTSDMLIPRETQMGTICYIEFLLFQQLEGRKPTLMEALNMPIPIRNIAAGIFQKEFLEKYSLEASA